MGTSPVNPPAADPIIWEADPDLRRFGFVSDNAARILGFPTATWRTQPDFWMNRLHPDDRRRFAAALREGFAQNADVGLEHRLQGADGGFRWLSTRVGVVRDDTGRPQRLIGTSLVITADEVAGEALPQRHTLESTITGISSRLINLSPDEVDAAIHDALGEVSACIEAERATLFHWDETSSRLVKAHEWYAAGLEPHLEEVKEIPLASNAWGRELIERDGVVRIDDAAALPPEAELARELCTTYGVRSAVFLRIRYRKTSFGGISFTTESAPRHWPDETVALLRIVGEIVAGALARQEAEEALRASEAHYRGVVEDQTELVCRFLPDTRLTFVNSAYCRYFGRTREELVGHSFLPLIPEADRRRAQEYFMSLSRDNPVGTQEHQAIRAGGEIAWQQWTNRALLDEHGILAEYQAVGRDVTDRKRAEGELRASEEAYRTLIEEHPDLVVLIIDGAVEYANEPLLRMVGHTLPEVRGRSPFDFIVPEERTRARERGARVLTSGDPSAGEYRLLRKDGTLAAVDIRSRRIRYRGRMALLSIIRDVEERRHAEDELRASEAAYRTLIEEIPGAVLLIVDGKLVYTNEAFRRMSGYTLEDIAGHSPLEIIAPEDAERAAERMRAILEGAPSYPSEYRAIAKDGSKHLIEIRTQRIHFRGETGLLSFMFDVGERKRAEDALRRHSTDLERLVQERTARIRELERQRAASESMAAIGRMAAGIAHEINNPLAGIKNSFLLIKDAVTPDHPYHSYVALIEREIGRIAGIVRQMFDLYRPDQSAPREVRLDTLLGDVVTLLEPKCRPRNVRIELGAVPGDVLYLPPGYLSQILLNVIQNAIEASPPAGVTRVSAAANDDHVVVTIADQGCGIPEELHDRIFEPFFTTKGEGSQAGLGLGLSVTRSLMEAMGGSIQFQSREGAGTTFQLILPRREPPKERHNG
jgi:two-component system sporulation sensor kinase C